jgi:hypothetical protein
MHFVCLMNGQSVLNPAMVPTATTTGSDHQSKFDTAESFDAEPFGRELMAEGLMTEGLVAG